MADKIEPHHIPQQNRRNKLRVFTTETNQDPTLPITQATPTISHQNPMNNHFPSSSSSSSTLQSLYPQNLLSHPNYSHNQYSDDQVPTYLNVRGNLSLSLSMQENQNLTVSVLGSDCLKQMRSYGPLGPFTGYALVLKQSRFLKPAQQILDSLCGVDFVVSVSPLEGFNEGGIAEDLMGLGNRVDQQIRKNSTLGLMLDEVYRRYKLYSQQMQSVIASFETVSGLGNAAPYMSLACKSVIKHFTCLKNTIFDRLHLSHNITSNDETLVKNFNPRINHHSADEQGLYDHNRPFLQHPVWRSQRSLPDHAVVMLRTWLFENFLHPYPTDSEKQMLALQTGLSRTQVSNWFINARVRLWKPMVEEIHMLEAQATNQPVSDKSLHSANAFLSTKPDEKTWDMQANSHRSESSKRQKQDKEANYTADRTNFSSANYDTEVGERTSTVTLALALNHQNNMGTRPLQTPFPLDMSRPFSIEEYHEENRNISFGAEYQQVAKKGKEAKILQNNDS